VTVLYPLPASGAAHRDFQPVRFKFYCPGSRVSLKQDGLPAILATNVTVIGPKKITCTFPIPANAPLGLRNADSTEQLWHNRHEDECFHGKGAGRTNHHGTLSRIPENGELSSPSRTSPGPGIYRNANPPCSSAGVSVVITGTNVTVVNSKKITCTFKIPILAATGAWNASVINGDNQKGREASAFYCQYLIIFKKKFFPALFHPIVSLDHGTSSLPSRSDPDQRIRCTRKNPTGYSRQWRTLVLQLTAFFTSALILTSSAQSAPSARRRSATWRLRQGSPCR